MIENLRLALAVVSAIASLATAFLVIKMYAETKGDK